MVTTSNTNKNMINHFEAESFSQTNSFHIRGSKLVNYSANLIKVFGQKLLNSLPANIGNSTALSGFEYKKYLIDQY